MKFVIVLSKCKKASNPAGIILPGFRIRTLLGAIFFESNSPLSVLLYVSLHIFLCLSFSLSFLYLLSFFLYQILSYLSSLSLFLSPSLSYCSFSDVSSILVFFRLDSETHVVFIAISLRMKQFNSCFFSYRVKNTHSIQHRSLFTVYKIS